MSDPVPFVSVFGAFRDAVVSRLAACSLFAGKDLQVLSRKMADIESEIDAQLTSVGVTLFVSPVQMKGVSADLPNVSSDAAEFIVAIFDNPTTNETGFDADALREICMRRLHLWDPGIVGVGVITLDQNPEDDRSNKKKVINDLTFHASITLEQGID